MKIYILSGGFGKRLWPVSRYGIPKQFKPLVGKKSLIKETYERVKSGFKASDIYIGASAEITEIIKKEISLPSAKSFIIEPVKRGTSAAIGLATAVLGQKNPNEIMATVNSDHYIKNVKEFNRILKTAEQAVKKYPDHLVLIGIKPRYPETGYGYIELGKQIDHLGQDHVFKVKSFKEKPDYKTAEKYLKSWHYLWNPAYFVFRAGTMLELYKKYLPKQYKIFAQGNFNSAKFKAGFAKIKKISVDYGIMEHAPKMLCIPAKFDWVDVGSWQTIHQILPHDKNHNVLQGQVLALNSQNNLIYNYSNKLVAGINLKNLVIIETGDVLLVVPKDKTQDVKKIVEQLEKEGKKKYL